MEGGGTVSLRHGGNGDAASEARVPFPRRPTRRASSVSAWRRPAARIGQDLDPSARRKELSTVKDAALVALLVSLAVFCIAVALFTVSWP